MDEKPWQWLISDMTEDIKFWIENGLDKENPDGFSKIQKTLKKAKERQVRDMKNMVCHSSNITL